MEVAKRVVDKYASPALKNLLNETGYGNNPEFFRMIVAIANDMEVAENSYVKPGAQTEAKKELHEYFYKNSKG